MRSKLPLLLTAANIARSSAFVPATNPTYALKHDYSGPNVFENFQFYSDKDPTNGHVKYVDAQTANSNGLAGFMPELTDKSANAQAPFYLGVDDKTPQSTAGRSSVRVNSIHKFNHALIIADILHMPAPVCGTWPAFWTLGSGSDWPNAGEIDILEGVNDEPFNRYTLHTSAGIVAANHSNVHQTGIQVTKNCDVKAPDQSPNAGCSTIDLPGIPSYGTELNDVQGGVYATLIDSEGVRIWFFARENIPADIKSGTPNPPPRDLTTVNTTGTSTKSTWSLPNARFDSPDNAPDAFDTHLKDHQIIINIAFCGDWAGKVWKDSKSCMALAPTCEEYVSGNPEAFTDVYWAFNSIKVYEPTAEGNETSTRRDQSLHKKVKRDL